VTAAPQPDWDRTLHDRRRLDAGSLRIQRALEQHLRGDRTTPLPADWTGPPAALDRLAERFGLAPFERDVLLLAVISELNPELARLCGDAHGDPAKSYPTFGLASTVLPGAFWDAFAPDRPLRRDRLVEIDGQPHGVMHARLAAAEPVTRYLLGQPTLDSRLGIQLDLVPVPEFLLPSHQAAARRLAAACGAAGAPLVHLVGRAGAAARDVAAAAAAQLDRRLYALAAETLPSDAAGVEALAALWQRDARLLDAALLVTVAGDGASLPERAARLARLADQAGGIVIVAGTEAAPALEQCRRPVLRLEMPPVSPVEIRAAWAELLGDAVGAAQLDRLADQFRFPVAGLRACIAAAHAQPGPQAEPFAERLWAVCREQGRHRLLGLAQLLPAMARSEDLVVPAETRNGLDQIIAQQRNRFRVLQDWGFAAQSSRGLGLTVLFEGPSGTGKTMAAEVVANALGLDLFRIDLSTVVDKYIGETEKNLQRLFDAAEESGAVLLFDEADVLFGKRSTVNDSHDRYANITVSYLLQRVEDYHGAAILTSNLPDHIDRAFARRLAVILQFPFPDRTQRQEIWQRVFPAGVPTDGLAFDRLAQLNISGGQIKTVARNAAFRAAEAGTAVDMRHILAATRVEYGKQHRVPVAAELAGWPA
jgi:ATPase family associated with various cellular activities (AAA)